MFKIRDDRVIRTVNNTFYTLTQNHIYAGADTGEDPLYTVVEHRVYPDGGSSGHPLLTYTGARVYWGASSAGESMLTANVPIAGNRTLEFLTPILLLERF